MYNLSKDYSQAFKDLYKNRFLICFVDFRFRDENTTEEPSRDICRCKINSNEITFGVRGHEYGSVDYINEMGSFYEEKAFVKECERLNASFILL